jgi:hypothetical protein
MPLEIVEYCERCGRKTGMWTMSMFNEEHICMDCEEKEKEHSDYDKARRKELEEVIKGNYDYPGIGKPDDL